MAVAANAYGKSEAERNMEENIEGNFKILYKFMAISIALLTIVQILRAIA